MTDDDTPESDRTVIQPGRPVPAPAPTPSADADDRTRIEPARSHIPTPPAAPPRGGSRQIAIGDVLNGTFEVTRFIARGGMGEVFEGTNIHTDEKLAIKVILPHLADDQAVQDLFRNEARTLQKLSHPALVRYVLLSKEMQFGVFYIVTEYIGGTNLSDVLADLKPSPEDLIALTRRLAEGLEAAHALGAVHRDIAPDNVILQDGSIRQARIIDFGIAKDLNPGSQTIIGDGFGGKLGFVAPEQLGDFNREVGAWSDVYSLGLVILSVAQGRKVDMGTSFVDAMDCRRKGVDTSGAPPAIRGVLDRMLIADPTRRLRSMAEVIAALNAAVANPAPAAKAKTAKTPKPATPKAPVREPQAEAKPNKTLLLSAGGAGAVLLLAVGGYFATRPVGPASPAKAPTVAAASGAAVEPRVRAAVTNALPTLPCAWLDLNTVKASPAGVSLAFGGVAGRTTEVEAEISKIVAGVGTRIASAEFGDVAPIPAPECDTINAVRQIRAAPGVHHLATAQRRYSMSTLTSGEYAGQMGASAIIDLTLGPDVRDFALYGVEPSGEITPILTSRAQFEAAHKGPGTQLSDLGNNHYRLQLDSNHSGWSGLVMLTGDGGFADANLKGTTASRPADWMQRFAAAAARGHWKAEMVWYDIVGAAG